MIFFKIVTILNWKDPLFFFVSERHRWAAGLSLHVVSDCLLYSGKIQQYQVFFFDSLGQFSLLVISRSFFVFFLWYQVNGTVVNHKNFVKRIHHKNFVDLIQTRRTITAECVIWWKSGGADTYVSLRSARAVEKASKFKVQGFDGSLWNSMIPDLQIYTGGCRAVLLVAAEQRSLT